MLQCKSKCSNFYLKNEQLLLFGFAERYGSLTFLKETLTNINISVCARLCDPCTRILMCHSQWYIPIPGLCNLQVVKLRNDMEWQNDLILLVDAASNVKLSSSCLAHLWVTDELDSPPLQSVLRHICQQSNNTRENTHTQCCFNVGPVYDIEATSGIYEKYTQCCWNVRPASTTLAQH